MQIIELYIRNGLRYYGSSTSTSSNNLVDGSKDFTTGVQVGFVAINLTDKTEAFVTSVAATTLGLSADIFTAGESYIVKSDFKRLDLFEDESVTITDSIKNVKDIGKIFTPFSQQFNVPASKHNSKIFRHYEDSDITNSFDARYKVDALIKLNGTDYKKGKIRLNSVSMKDNKPHSYKLVFFGDTVELKDILGETLLSGLTYDSSLDFDYTRANVLSKFTTDNLDVSYPLITHTKNMRFTNAGYKSNEQTPTLLNFTDIKPAIKIRKIIEAIESTFPEIEFTGDFLNTEDFNRIYMWMHREKGFMSNADEGSSETILDDEFFTPQVAGFSPAAGTTEARPYVLLIDEQQVPNAGSIIVTFTIETANAANNFDIRVVDDTNGTVIDSTGNTGSTSYTFTYNLVISTYTALRFRSTITSSEVLNLLAYRVNIVSAFFGINDTYESDSLAVLNKVVINRHMPKMKAIDFLTNIFKLFNLVAFKQDDKIRVLPLDDFYSEGVNYDITKYVDVSKSEISKVLQFRSIDFNFKSKKTFLVQKSDELQGSNFAGENLTPSNTQLNSLNADGSDYKIEADFEKMMFERLSNDQDTTQLTTICQGAFLDKEFKPTIGKPLLIYIASQTTSDTFEFDNSAGSNTSITTYNRPSQVLVQSGAVGDASAALNFGVEADEFFQEAKGTNLLQKYYINYIVSVFNRQARIKKIDAYLPLHIILSYNLSDRFIIGNKVYRINSIKTNLLTNKSSLELYSLAQNVTDIANSQVSSLPRIAALNIGGTSSSSVTLGWTPLGDAVANNITGYDVIKDDVFVETLGNDISGRTISGLDSKITYKFAIRTRYTIGGTVFFSNDRIAFATTD
tara:strand:- start:1925 stop:4477 length:2553 start_codon:yes stop_codon:yes gene_type:complete